MGKKIGITHGFLASSNDLKEKIKSGYFNTDPDILKGIDKGD